ncbi:MAG TPA: tetratricopeptide repeat protein [Spirochaetota bacterium]|nr:tetratricopeptide repeat protein [Spirochaetota bacterium]
MLSVSLTVGLLLVAVLNNSPAQDALSVTIEQKPQHTIYEKEGILYCSGNTEAAVCNNKGADELAANNVNDAIAIFQEGLTHAPLFYPFLYNIGIAYMRNRQFDEARVYLEKAKHIVPENPRIYILIGELYAFTGREGDALVLFKQALNINKKELDAIIKIGTIYIERNQLELALRYFNSALNINPKYSDAGIGFAKVFFKKGEYYKALIRLKSIDITQGNYDKAYHYYYAESSYKLKDYKTAYEQYKQLLVYKDDIFFLTHSYALIEHRMNLARQFAELENVK